MSKTIFERIIEGEIPSRMVYEDEKVVAFLDVDQSEAGHLLVVPRVAVDKFYDVDEVTWVHLMKVSQKLAKRLEKATGLRTLLKIIGTDVPHTHVHLVPLEKVRGEMQGENALGGKTDDEIQETIMEAEE